MMQTSIGIVIPTYQGIKHLPHCLPPLLHSSLCPKILVIDSSSSDGTAAFARSMGVETWEIPKNEFNHGVTREKGRKYLNTSIIVMFTQDAYLVSSDMLADLIAPILEGKASLTYGRQIPHEGASIYATFARSFNYPEKSQLRALKDFNTYGVYTFFCSNSCAAYSNTALNEIGGFPCVDFGEDTIVAARLLHRGHRIAYVAETTVHHSHEYTLKQEFRRHFEIGKMRRAYRNLFHFQKIDDYQRGNLYIKNLLRKLYHTNPRGLFYAIGQAGIKFAGYKIGWMWQKLYEF